jgi:chromatin segregation and condensation protein Rec8/ScpA/Scc1 (kleisin family)
VWDEVTVFMSVLFLAAIEKIKLWQEDYPDGEIYVKRLAAEDTLSTEDLVGLPKLGPPSEAAPEGVAS